MSPSPPRAVGWWLLLVAFAVLVQVGLGGITRLTDSGLSITEWKPLLGVIPPLDDAGWAEAFAKYQQIPQYIQLKSHLTPAEFRFIYFWEWFHRLWGRLLGVFFGVPFLIFWARGQVKGLGRALLVLFALGGLQGALGWFMVASGLQDLVYVSHLRLAAHLMMALFLLCALVWTGLSVLRPVPSAQTTTVGLRKATWTLLGLLAVQLTWGAFLAGLKAVLMAPTWPSINGFWLPDAVWSELPWQHPLSVHFIHRTLGYLLLAGFIAWWWASRKALGFERHLVLGLGLTQVVLGISTILFSTHVGALLWFGLAHQLVGSALAASLAASAHALRTSALQRRPELIPAAA